MKKYLLAWFLSVCTSLAFAGSGGNASQPFVEDDDDDDLGNVVEKLKLSAEQKEQFQKIHFEMMKKEIELRSKLELSRLELGRLLTADQPDRSAVEKKVGEVADNEGALRMNKLNAWFELNKGLTPEQQKIWRGVLHKKIHERMMGARRMQMREHRPPHPPMPMEED